MATSIASPGAAPQDDLDALLYSDPNVMDENSKKSGLNDKNSHNTRSPIPGQDTTARRSALGLDDEVKISKKRQPVAKLDATRLLSDTGIPKLQRISKDRLKFRGQGHEFSDVVRLLRTYQLWLDDLYPRAKFDDGLAIIEKLGHSKRMQIMRKAWIDEGKLKAPAEEEDNTGPEILPLTFNPGFEFDAAQSTQVNGSLRSSEMSYSSNFMLPTDSLPLRDLSSLHEVQEAPDEHELDALLAADAREETCQRLRSLENPPDAGQPLPHSARESTFEDDEEAMREMDELW